MTGPFSLMAKEAGKKTLVTKASTKNKTKSVRSQLLQMAHLKKQIKKLRRSDQAKLKTLSSTQSAL